MFGSKDQNGVLSGGMVESRAGITGRVGAVQPGQAARVAVEGRAGSPGVEDNEIVPKQRRAGKAPSIGDDSIMPQIMFPDDCPFGGIEAEDIAPLAEGEDAIALNRGSRDWAAFVINGAEF